MNILRDDATKVNEALAALAAHDRKVSAMLSASLPPPAGSWTELATERRRLGAVLEERAGILARLVLAAHPAQVITRADVEVSP